MPLPYLTSQAPWFTFLVHPRDVRDLYEVPGATVVAEHSSSEEEFSRKLCSLPPTVVSDVTFGFSPVRGEVIAVLQMPEAMMHLKGRRAVEEAVRLATHRGAAVIGLGALTAPATQGGLTLLPNLPKGVTLTTGNALTAAVACRNVLQASQALGLGTAATVAVVGCTGSVGVPASRLLAAAGFGLVLIGRSLTRVERELGDLASDALVSSDRADVSRADVVLLLTGDRTARLTAEEPRPGSVVIDVAHPTNIDRSRFGEFAERDVTVVQGGLVTIPGYHCATDFRLPDRRSVLACLAETFVFAREGIREHSVGKAPIELALHIESVARRHGVQPRPLDLAREAVAVT
jgi:predicted amino acid dehydrogenase